MNRKSLSILFIVVIILLSQASIVSARGRLSDENIFYTYIGKSRPEVRNIAPAFSQIDDDYYLIDYLEFGNDCLIVLAAEFDEYDCVEAVDIHLTKSAINEISVRSGLKNYGWWDFAVDLFGLAVDIWDISAMDEDPNDPDVILDSYLRGKVAKGVSMLDEQINRSDMMDNALKVGMYYLGFSEDDILSQENNGYTKVIELSSGIIIGVIEEDEDTYLITGFELFHL